MSTYTKPFKYYVWLVSIVFLALVLVVAIQFFRTGGQSNLDWTFALLMTISAVIFASILLFISSRNSQNFMLKERGVQILAQRIHHVMGGEVPYKNIESIVVRQNLAQIPFGLATLVINTDIKKRANVSGFARRMVYNRVLSRALPYSSRLAINGLSKKQAEELKKNIEKKAAEHYDPQAGKETFNWRKARSTNRSFVGVGVIFFLLLAYLLIKNL